MLSLNISCKHTFLTQNFFLISSFQNMKPLFLSRLFLVTLSLITLLNLEQIAHGWVPVDPTEGFISLPLNQSNFVIQRPFNVPQEQRYSFVNGTHKLWVYSTDKPHSPTSHTRPRTEIRIHVNDNGFI